MPALKVELPVSADAMFPECVDVPRSFVLITGSAADQHIVRRIRSTRCLGNLMIQGEVINRDQASAIHASVLSESFDFKLFCYEGETVR